VPEVILPDRLERRLELKKMPEKVKRSLIIE
jgi:hypothetical protein